MHAPWLNPEKTAAQRAELLLAEMTIREKCGQLCQRLTGFSVFEWNEEQDKVILSEEFCREVEAYQGMGLLYGLYRADPWSGRNFSNGLWGERAIRAYNAVQTYVMEHSRLRIPVLMTTECPHGHQALDGYLLPVNLASGATFDPELLERAEAVCGQQLKEMGAHMALVSMLDMLRDPRWGRSEECFGEDPYLSAELAGAAVRGFRKTGTQVVAKHFAAQGEGTGGVNASAARIGERELREIHLPAARAAVEAGCEGIMAAYNEIDGVFCHANEHLLKEILREEFGFPGIVMADGCAIDNLNLATGDTCTSGALALQSGVDAGLWDRAFSMLPEALERGLIREDDLDQAVRRVLIRKFEAGLFETPLLNVEYESCTEDGTELPGNLSGHFDPHTMYTDHPETLELARESVILLTNRNQALPLGNPDQGTATNQDTPLSLKIACIGPNADDIYRQLGDYTPEIRKGSGMTVRSGLQTVFGEAQVLHAEGCGLRRSDESLLMEAEKQAAASDVTILVLGGSSSRFEGVKYLKNGAAELFGDIVMDCGEGVDLSDLSIPEAQMVLFRRVRKQAKKLITVVIAGRPLILTELCERSDAVLLSFYPGPMGGLAIAEILAGLVNPSGCLPASLPAANGQLPVYYNYKKSYTAWRYRDGNEVPDYRFGFGMDYSDIQVEDVLVACAGSQNLEQNPEEAALRSEKEQETAAVSTEKKQETADTNVEKKQETAAVNTGETAEILRTFHTEEVLSQGLTIRGNLHHHSGPDTTAVLQLYVEDVSASVVPRARALKAFSRVSLKRGEEKKFSLHLKPESFLIVDRKYRSVLEPGRFVLYLEEKGHPIWQSEIEIL